MSDRTVFVVRHARAHQESASGDAGRQLTDAGRDAFVRLARARRGDLAITRILSSPFLRAVETARLLAEVTAAPVEEEAELASGARGGRELLDLARRAGPGVALVGHNPEVQEMIALAGGAGTAVPPGTIAALALEDGAERLLWVATPANDR